MEMALQDSSFIIDILVKDSKNHTPYRMLACHSMSEVL